MDPQMAEEHPAQTVQHAEDTNETFSRHGRSRPHEDKADRTTPPWSPEIHSSSDVFKCWHESSQSSDIEDFIYQPTQPSTLPTRLFRPKDADCAWVSPSNQKCPASFGDNGTTATAGASGQLVQISDYLGAGNSGMFSAGHCYTEEPYLVTRRTRSLHSLASEPFEQAQRRDYSDVFGLKLNLELLGDPPKLKWFQYKWPRYVFKRRCFKDMENVGLTIQFIVRNGTVFQQCILENRGYTNIDLKLAFCKAMSIWDLDHVTDEHQFNETTPDHQNAGPGPGGFGWVHVNRFREGSPGSGTSSQDSVHTRKSKSSHGNSDKKDQPNYGVALVVSMAVDGEMIKFAPGQSPHTWKQTLKAKSSTSKRRSQKTEIVTAYRLVLLANPLTDWKTFVIPLTEMNPSKFLRGAREVSSFRTWITRIRVKDAQAYDEQDPETLKGEENKGEEGPWNAPQDEVVTVDGEPQTEPLPAFHHGSTPEKSSTIMEQIEFSARRNLEHILSVCAIPVAVPVSGENAVGIIWEKLRDVQPIALTCGDMSGHRICTTSSFFAFQFLTEVAKRLNHLPQPDRDDNHVQALLSRIRDVCLGHLKWLCAAEQADQDEAFGSLYWVSGEPVTLPESSQSWAPDEHVRDTAFQILKAVEFANAFNDADDGESSLVGEMISQWGRGWMRWLERSDRRESLTWSHKEDQGLKTFRLDDHIWIWRALKAMEDRTQRPWEILHDRAPHNDESSTTGLEASNADEILLPRSRKFASRTVQREVLRKFTTENEVLRKKMVALTRSPRETRFLFHARDTAVFYAQDMGFFPEDTSFRDMWKNTIDAQRFHENSQEDWWDNALRYALSMMLGIRGHQINNRRPRHMVRTAAEVLFRSSGASGLFPGKLDIMTKGPLEAVFREEKDADSYYEAGFEIPYIFLLHSEEIEAVLDNSADPVIQMQSGNANIKHHPTGKDTNSNEAIPTHHTSNTRGQSEKREEISELRILLAKLSDVLSARSYVPNSTSASDYTGSRELVVDARLALKKSIPFSNIIESHSIFEIEDEWLFNFPSFFGSEKDKNTSIDKTLDSLKDLGVGWLSNINVAEMRRKYSSYNTEDGRPDDESEGSSHYRSSASNYYSWSTSSYYSPSSATASSISHGSGGDPEFWVVDMPSRKRLREKGVSSLAVQHKGSFESIWELISRPRTVAKAKKRSIFCISRVADAELEAALLCYAASMGDERANMLEFFERHFQQEKFMFDHCNLASNTWETELHLTFFILEDAAGPLSDDKAHNIEGFPGVRGKNIFRVSVGCRFYGDAFDRYWTLHLFSNLDLEVLEGKMDAFGRLSTTNEKSMLQRKVLEGFIISGILDHATSSTERILAEVKSEMGIKSGAFSWSVPSMDTYSSWSKLWEGFAPLLQALTDDLTSTQGLIGQWETREGGRGQEKPRWTHNDEKKYRVDITRGQRVLERRKRRIQDLLDDVESLREACTARLANAREELSFRSNQNIASFTYVTIVFLPLGFAASVFGMNGYPAAGWVASMAVIAVVALTITVIALTNTKLLLTAAKKFSRDAMRLTGAVFQSSLIGQHKRQQDERAQASPVSNKPAYGDQNGGDPLQTHATRHVLFWMAYLFIELPARRVALACRALPASLMQNLGLLRPDATPPASVGSTDRSPGPPASVSSTGGSSGARAAAVGRKFIRIAGGILILPLLLISWTIQLLFYNVFDILAFLGRLTREIFYALVIPSDANGVATDSKMVTWLIEPPSSLRPVRKYLSRDEKSEEPTSQADTPVAANGSNSGPLEQV